MFDYITMCLLLYTCPLVFLVALVPLHMPFLLGSCTHSTSVPYALIANRHTAQLCLVISVCTCCTRGAGNRVAPPLLNINNSMHPHALPNV